MPQIDPGYNAKKKKAKKLLRPPTRPDAGEATRKREPSKALAGDKPQERSKGADASIDNYKQTDHYVGQVQAARAHRDGFRGKKNLGDRAKVADSDRNYFRTHRRVEDAKPTPPPRLRYEVDPNTGRARTMPALKPLPGPKTKKDEPRTDPEVRKFLKTGKRPNTTTTPHDPVLAHVPPAVAMVAGPGGKVPKIGAMAASLLIGKEAARPLHASAAALQGKNPVKGFKKGTDTGSDVVKHYLGKPHSKLGKIGAAVGGEALNVLIDPLSHGRANVRSPMEHLERKANMAERSAERATGKATKARTTVGTKARTAQAARRQARSDRLRAKSKKASPHRGIQVGVSKRAHGTIPGTSKLAGSPVGQTIARATHDNTVSQAIGKVFVPHMRDRTVPKEMHEKDKAALRRRNHELNAADRHGERRGTAYTRAQRQAPDKPETITAAAERAPKGTTPDFVHTKVLTPEHRAVSTAKQKERSAKHTAATKTGRAQYETSQADKAIRHRLIDTFRKRDQGANAREVGKLGHAQAHQLHAELTDEIGTLDTLITRLERRPAVSRSAKHSAQLARARTRRDAAAKLQKDVDARWGTYSPGTPERVVKGKARPPQRTLKPLDQSINDLEQEAAGLREKRLNAHNAQYRGGQVQRKVPQGKRAGRMFANRGQVATDKIKAGFTPEDARHLKGLEQRLGRFHREGHLEAVEPAVRGYMKASGNAKIKSIARGKARKGYRNAHGEDPITGEVHPYYKVRRPVTGAEALYSDNERALKAKAFDQAARGHEKAQRGLTAAEAELRATAESQAGEHAMGRPGVTILRNYGRLNPTTLGHLNDARAGADAATAVRERAEEKATGMRVIHDPNTGKILGKTKVGERIPRHETKFVEADSAGKPVKGGQTWGEYLDTVRRHDSGDLSGQGGGILYHHQREMGHLHAELKAHGLLDEPVPDYVHHMKDPESVIEQVGRNLGRAKRSANLAAGEPRVDPRPIKSQNEHGQTFSNDLPTINANYIREARRAIADSRYLKHLQKLGRPLTKSVKFDPETEGVYAITNKRITAVNEKERQAFLDKAPGARDGVHVILPKGIGDREIQGKTRPIREAMGTAFDKINSEWKTLVTVYNAPFYQERNLYDDTLRFWYGDGNPKHFIQASKLLKQQVAFEHGEKTLAGAVQPKILKEAEEDGIIRSGHFAADLEHVGKSVRVKHRPSLTGLIRGGGGNLEDVPRLASYLSALDKGMTREQAAHWTRIHHFDYSELTDAERIIRRAVPFWTFTSRNVALQTRTLLTRPGKFSQFQAFREEMAKLAGLPPDWDTTQLDETQQRALPVPFRVGTNKDGSPNIKVYYPSFSNTDLNRLPIPLGHEGKGEVARRQYDMWAQTMTPLIKAPWELLSNHSFFFRGAIYPDAQNTDVSKWVPAPNWANTPAVKKVLRSLGGDVIMAPDPKTKKLIPQWNGVADYMMRQMPQTGFVTTLDTPVRNQRGQTSGDRIFGQLTGIRRTSLDPTRGDQQALRTDIANKTITRNDINRRGKAADPQYDTIVSDRYDKLNKSITAEQKQLDAMTGKVDTTRLQSRPGSFTDEVNKRIEQIKKQRSADAIRQQVKRRQQRLALQQEISRRQR